MYTSRPAAATTHGGLAEAYALDATQTQIALEIFHTRPIVQVCRNVFIGRNLVLGIQMRIRRGTETVFEPSDYMQHVLNTHYLAFLKRAYDWESVFGVVPWFIRTIPETGERVPDAPPFECGQIFTGYNTRQRRQEFFWVWRGDAGAQRGMPHASTLSGLVTHGGRVGDVGALLRSCDRDVRFFTVPGKEPTTDGQLRSDIASAITDYIQLRRVGDLLVQLERKKLHVPLYLRQDLPPSEVYVEHWDRLRNMAVETANNPLLTHLVSADVGDREAMPPPSSSARDVEYGSSGDAHSALRMNRFLRALDSGSSGGAGGPVADGVWLDPQRQRPGEHDGGGRDMLRAVDVETGALRELHMRPMQHLQEGSVHEGRRDYLQLCNRFDQHLSSLLDFPASFFTGSTQYRNEMQMFSAQSLSSLGMNNRIARLESYVRHTYWFIHGHEHVELRHAIMDTLADREGFRRRMQQRLAQRRRAQRRNARARKRRRRRSDEGSEEAAPFPPLQTAAAAAAAAGVDSSGPTSAPAADSDGDLDADDGAPPTEEELEWWHDAYVRTSEIADALVNIEARLETNPFTILPDFGMIQRFYETGLMSPEYFSRLMSGMMGIEIRAEAPPPGGLTGRPTMLDGASDSVDRHVRRYADRLALATQKYPPAV